MRGLDLTQHKMSLADEPANRASSPNSAGAGTIDSSNNTTTSKSSARLSQRKGSLSQNHHRPLSSPSRHRSSSILHGMLQSSPTSPPTPAPSPTPHERAPIWNDAGEDEDAFLRDVRAHFSRLSRAERERFLTEVLNLCDSQQLGFVLGIVSPRLRKDPFSCLPNELCLRILSFVDDAKTLARASQVSRLWRDLLSDDMAWKLLCEKHAYRRLSEAPPPFFGRPLPEPLAQRSPLRSMPPAHQARLRSASHALAGAFGAVGASSHQGTRGFDGTPVPTSLRQQPLAMSYRAHFKQRYQVETAWRHGGRVQQRHITPDQGVVTSLHLTPKYIIVALDNAKIHVFNTDGDHQSTLIGHAMGVWAMVPCGDVLVSGGCDRDVRVWDLLTGESKYVLRGHTSTVRCLKMSEDGYAISSSRDTTLRVWNINSGLCKNILVGHQASVRCLAVHGDLVVSGSYDTVAKIWSISDGRCLRTLAGHFSQIYAVAFDGRRIATGSLDTSVRIWDPNNGHCLGVLQGHTSLVGHLQMRGNTLVTGGSDGSVRVWSLRNMAPFHRLAAHDNSVMSLQSDDVRVVSGGCDGRVKVWDLKTGQLVRELGKPADAVWMVAFEDEKAVIMASRNGRTIMEVWSFSPPPDDVSHQVARSETPASVLDGVSTDDDDDGDMKMTEAPEKAPASTSDDSLDVHMASAGSGPPRQNPR